MIVKDKLHQQHIKDLEKIIGILTRTIAAEKKVSLNPKIKKIYSRAQYPGVRTQWRPPKKLKTHTQK